MTDQTITEDAQDAEQTIEAPESTDETTEPHKGNAEAAKYRKRAQSAEAERDQLTATLDTYRGREAVTMAESAGLIAGADLLDSVSLADLLAEDGTVDPESVTAATAALLEAKPHLRRGKPDFGGGDRGVDVGAGEPDPLTKAADAIRGKRR